MACRVASDAPVMPNVLTEEDHPMRGAAW